MVWPWGTPIPFTNQNQKLGEIQSLLIALDNRVAIEQGRDISTRLMCYSPYQVHIIHIWAKALPVSLPNLDHIYPIPFDFIRVFILKQNVTYNPRLRE